MDDFIMFGSIEYYQWVTEKTHKYASSKQKCMCPNCTENAIVSHVMQKGNILSSIAPYSHLYYIESNLFCETMMKYNKVGISKVMTFNGFCNNHDTQIFEPIEKRNVSWREIESQYLISYRALCYELRQQELSLHLEEEIFSSLLKETFDRELIKQNELHIQSLRDGVEILVNSKIDLEKGVFNKDYSRFEFETIVLPYKLELCISAINEHYLGVDTKCLRICNVFPYNNSTVVIIGYSKRYGKLFSKLLSSEFKTNNPYRISQTLSNLIIYHSRCHCLSEDLYNSLSNDTKDALIKEFVDTLNYTEEITQNTENNFLLEHVLTKCNLNEGKYVNNVYCLPS